MIEVKNAPYWRRCSACNNMASKVIRLEYPGRKHAIFGLCPECIKRLFDEVKSEDTKV